MSQLNKLVEFTLMFIGEIENKELAEKIVQAFKSETQNKTEKEVESWIDSWVALFPADVTTGGRPVQSSPDECFDKMVKFMKRTKYNKDMVFKATESYLEERGVHGFAYTKAAQYFIDKRGEGSLLEDWCRKIINEDVEDTTEDDNNSVFI